MIDGSVGAAGLAALESERRRRLDRRSLSWRTVVHGSLTPRRRGYRRGTESEGLLDWHEPHLMALAIGILLLSVCDAFLTVRLIANGATEANPIMAYLLEEAPSLFAAAKMALTGTGIVVLVALARARIFRVIRISVVIHWCMLGYLALILYEAWLLSRAVNPFV